MANKVWKERNYSIDAKAKIMQTISEFQKVNNWFDDSDFAYFVKELLENGRVYVSKEAYKVIQCYDTAHTRFTSKVLEKLMKGEPQEVYLQKKTHGTHKEWGAENELCWEHVVPTAILVNSFLKSTINLEKILELGIVCIVLKTEDSRLTENGLKDNMPDDWDHNDIWARYKKAKIEVVGDPFMIEK